MAEKSRIYLFIKFIAVFLAVITIFLCFYPAVKTRAEAVIATGLIIAAVVAILGSMGIVISGQSGSVNSANIEALFSSFLRTIGTSISDLASTTAASIRTKYLVISSVLSNIARQFGEWLITNLNLTSDTIHQLNEPSYFFGNKVCKIGTETVLFDHPEITADKSLLLYTFSNGAKLLLSQSNSYSRVFLQIVSSGGTSVLWRDGDTLISSSDLGRVSLRTYSDNILYLQNTFNSVYSVYYDLSSLPYELTPLDTTITLTNSSGAVGGTVIDTAAQPYVYINTGSNTLTIDNAPATIMDKTQVADLSDVSTPLTVNPRPPSDVEIQDGLPLGNRLLDDLNDGIDDFNNTIDEDVDNILDSLDPIVDLVNSIFDIFPAIVQYLISFAVVFLVLRKVVGR